MSSFIPSRHYLSSHTSSLFSLSMHTPQIRPDEQDQHQMVRFSTHIHKLSLSFFLSFSLCSYIYVCLSVCRPVCLSASLSVCLSISLPFPLSVYVFFLRIGFFLRSVIPSFCFSINVLFMFLFHEKKKKKQTKKKQAYPLGNGKLLFMRHKGTNETRLYLQNAAGKHAFILYV